MWNPDDDSIISYQRALALGLTLTSTIYYMRPVYFLELKTKIILWIYQKKKKKIKYS